MKKMLLLVLLLFVHGSLGRKIQLKDLMSTAVITEAQSFFDTIPLQDRDNFIIYYLDKGLRQKWSSTMEDVLDVQSNFSKFDDLVAPENFSANLLNWVQEEFLMLDEDISKLIADRLVCFENGRCINPSDVGFNCCPY